MDRVFSRHNCRARAGDIEEANGAPSRGSTEVGFVVTGEIVAEANAPQRNELIGVPIGATQA